MLSSEEKIKKDPQLEEENFIPERPDYEAELIEILKSDATDEQIRDKLNDYHENDIAAILEDLSSEERKKLFKIIGNEVASEVFAYLDDDFVAEIVEELESGQAADIIESMDADEAVDILDELEEDKRQELESLLDEEAKRDIDLIHSYDEDEIGSRMSTNFVVISKGISIRQAMKSLVEQAAQNDNISTIYVVDENEVFFGAIDLPDLIVARQYTSLEDITTTSYPYVYDHENMDECLEEIKDYSEDSIPVLDNEKKILGVITAQDIIEAVDEEMGEDYAKLAGLTAEEDLKETLLESMKKRIPWLIILFLLGLVVSSVVGIFEHVVAELTIIMAFQSMILDMAGNVGTQSLAVTIRVLMDEELDFKEKLRFVFKEARVGMTNGAILGGISFVAVGLYIAFAKGYGTHMGFAVSGCIGLALFAAVLIASFVGTIIPMFFHRIHVDPAVASGPLITTVNDLVAVVTYYGLAWALLINVMGL